MSIVNHVSRKKNNLREKACASIFFDANGVLIDRAFFDRSVASRRYTASLEEDRAAFLPTERLIGWEVEGQLRFLGVFRYYSKFSIDHQCARVLVAHNERDVRYREDRVDHKVDRGCNHRRVCDD